MYIHEKDITFVTEPNSHIEPWSGGHSAPYDAPHALQAGQHQGNWANMRNAAPTELSCTWVM